MDLYRKNGQGDWLILNYEAGAIVMLNSLQLSFPIGQIYPGLTLTPTA